MRLRVGVMFAAAVASASCRPGVPHSLSLVVAPIEARPARGAVEYVAMREEADARAGFGGDRGPSGRGPLVDERGGACVALESACPLVSPADPSRRVRDAKPSDDAACAGLETGCPALVRTMLALPTSARTVLYVVQGTAGQISAETFASFYGAVDSPEKAALLVWLRGYDLAWSEGNARFDGAYVRSVEGGFEVLASRAETTCPGDGPEGQGFVGTRYARLLLRVEATGAVTEKARTVYDEIPNADACRPLGRRPAGMRRAAFAADAGGYFARATYLEACSVHAFERLARELALHRAPRALVQRARAAARDEARHARSMAQLARRFDGCLVSPRVDDVPPRSLEEIARENAVEGCVLEAYAAIVALFQAEHAADTEVRRRMKRIARDEVRHCELALDVDRWACARLPIRARRRVRRARREGVRALSATMAASLDTVGAWAGEPTALQVATLCAAVAALA